MREKIHPRRMLPGKLISVICGSLLLAACTEFADLKEPRTLRTPSPMMASEVPVADWTKIQDSGMLATEFLFTPNDPVFRAGMPYRLKIRNVGESEHVLKGPHFLRAIAIREVSLKAYISHLDIKHADKAIGPDNADGVPKIPPAKKGARNLVAENNAEAIRASGGGDPKEADNPFAAKPEEEEEEDGPSEGGTEGEVSEEGASNPFADDAKEEDAAEEGGEASAEEAAEADGEASAEDDGEASAEGDTEIKVEDDDSDAENDETISAGQQAPSEEADDDDAVGEGTKAADSEESEPEEADTDDTAEETDKSATSDDVAADTAADTSSGMLKTGVDWQPVSLERITIPVGHEVTIEFVAVHSGKYRFFSADARYALAGMFGTATIEAPEAESEDEKAPKSE